MPDPSAFEEEFPCTCRYLMDPTCKACNPTKAFEDQFSDTYPFRMGDVE